MNEFFILTTSLSAHSKWVLIRLISKKTIGDELSKSDLIELGCPHNKFKKVVDELLKINAILVHNVEHIKKGRPSNSYIFIYDKYTEMNKLLSSEMLAQIEGEDFRVPVKIVWCFFCLNKDEFGFVENLSVPVIAKACKLKNVEVKTAIAQLVASNKIQQLTTGCTFKKNGLFTHEENLSITKRASAYALSIPNYDTVDELKATPLNFNFNLFLSSKEAKTEDYVSSICNSLPINIANRYKVLFDVHLKRLFSKHSLELFKSYLADQPKNSIDNFRRTLGLLVVKCIKKIISYKNRKQHLSILDISKSLFGTTDIFHMNSNLYHLSSFITSYIKVYVNCFLFNTYVYFKKSTPSRVNVKTYRNYISEIDNFKADAFFLNKKLFLHLNTNNLTPNVRIAFSSKI